MLFLRFLFLEKEHHYIKQQQDFLCVGEREVMEILIRIVEAIFDEG